jgi:hypothetical protein
MSYDVKNLSTVALSKIVLVLDDIKLISELRNRKHSLLYKLGNLANITKDEQESVLLRLLRDKTVKQISLVSFLTDAYILRIDDDFFDFYNKAKIQLESGKKPINAIPSVLSFDQEKSILYLNSQAIEISKKNEKTNAHYILEHIFNSDEGLKQQFSFWEIAEDTFKDEEYDKPRKYYRACGDIQDKVRDITGIKDFLEFKSGRKGWVQINQKYLKQSK